MLVNSAGIGIGGRVEDAQLKHIDRQLAINVRGLVLVTQAAIPHLRKTKGWIVNLASIAGTQPVPMLPVYAATKAAVISLTHSLNADLDDDGVRRSRSARASSTRRWRSSPGCPAEEMIQPEDCAEVVRMCLRLSPRARVPQVVIERVGSSGKIACSRAYRSPGVRRIRQSSKRPSRRESTKPMSATVVHRAISADEISSADDHARRRSGSRSNGRRARARRGPSAGCRL